MTILCIMSLFAAKIKQAEIQLLGKQKTIKYIINQLRRNRRNLSISVAILFSFFVISCIASCINGFKAGVYGISFQIS